MTDTRGAPAELPGMPDRTSLWPPYKGKPVTAVLLKFTGGDELGAADPFDGELAEELTCLGRVLTLRVEVELAGVQHELEENKYGPTGNVLGTARLKVRRVMPPAVDSETGEVVIGEEEVS